MNSIHMIYPLQEQKRPTRSSLRSTLIRHLGLFALIAMGSTITQAQMKMDMGHGSAMLDQARELVWSDNKAEALKLLGTVHPNDSLYDRALQTRFYLLVDDKKFEEANTLSILGMRAKGKLRNEFMVMHTAILVDLEKWEDALAAADSAIVALPGLYRPRHLRSLSLAELGRKKEALEQSMDNAKRFPYRREAHVRLGTLAFNEGLVSQAAMAYAMAQVVRYDDDFANTLLGQNDGALGATIEAKSEGYDLSVTGDDLSEEDLLIRSKVAMDKDYKCKPDLTYPICRQSHLLFTSIHEKKGELKGFYSEFYGPLINEIMDQGLFEGFIYHCLLSSTDKGVKSLASKNKSKVEAFRAKMGDVMQKHYIMFPEEEGGANVMHIYNNDGDMVGYGPGDPINSASSGQWNYYYSNGPKRSWGNLDNDGKRTGTWSDRYESGIMSSRAEYKAGEIEGLALFYHETGALSDSIHVVDGKRNGQVCMYYEMGGLRNCKTTVAGAWTGPVTEYYRNGAPEWTYALKEGITEGTVKQQYNTGGTAFIGEYINDLRSGTHNEMYPDGAKKSSYSYTEGKGNGAYTKWSADGMLSEEGTLKNNVIIGERKTYDQWGTLDVLMRFDEQGRAQGTRVENNDEGNPFVEMEYNKDLLIRYSYRDRTGKVIGEGTRSKGRFDLKGYNMDSGLRVEGVYLDEGQKDGKWKYYQADGTLENEENFKNGEPDGKQLFYSEDGSNFGFDENYSRNDITYTAFERYYRDGKMLYEGQIKGDNNDGAYRRYYPDGTLDQDLYYVAGRFHGWQVYYDVDGKKIYATRYENGTMMEQINYDRDGNAYETVVVTPGAFEFVQHHYNGAVRSRWAVMNAMLNGKATWYYPDGSVEVEGEFLNGDRHGKWTGYHTNGKKSYEREYVMGNSIGQYTQWFANGTMQSETPYVAGYVSGLAKEYHDNGKISFQRNYGYGNYHGDHSSYTLNGEPQMVRFYHKGRLYAYGSPTADGTVKDTIHVSSGIANCTSTFPDGTKARQINFRNGEIDGKFIEYHANGKVMESAEYQVGQIVGEHEEFYADGTPKQTTPYVAGLKHGEQIAYWNTGKVKEKRNFKFGEEQGLRTFHDQTGKLLATFDVRDNDVVEIIK